MDASSSRADSARFEYTLGSAVDGEVRGQCVSVAALAPIGFPGSLRLHADEGTLEEYVTEWNRTTVLPNSADPTRIESQWVQRRTGETSLPAGTALLSWSETGRLRIFGAEWPGRGPPFTARFETDELRTQPVGEGVDGAEYFVERDGRVELRHGGVAGWNRLVEARGANVEFVGDLTLYLEEAQLEDARGNVHRLPPARENTTLQDTPGVRQETHAYRHALLRLPDARVEFDAPFACRDLTATVRGMLLAHAARGELSAGNRSLPFGPADLSLGGRFQWTESFGDDVQDPPRVQGRAEGEIQVAGLDFVAADVGGGPPILPVAAGSVLVAILLTVAAWRLYTRLQRPALLELETRNLVHEALRANPWTSLPELQRATGLRRSTLRYQLDVLRRHALVRTQHVASQPRFALVGDADAPAVPQDPVAVTLRGRLGQGPLRLAEAMRLLMEQHGYSRFGAWKAVRRATHEGLVHVDRNETGVWIR